MIEIELKGLDELLRDLRALPSRARRNALRSGLGAGATAVLKAAKTTSAFHDRTGRLRRSLKKKDLRMRRTDIAFIIGTYGKDGSHAHLIEFGHMQYGRVSKDGGFTRIAQRRDGSFGARGSSSGSYRVVGHVAARPFLRPALWNNQDAIEKATFAKVRKVLEKKIGKQF